MNAIQPAKIKTPALGRVFESLRVSSPALHQRMIDRDTTRALRRAGEVAKVAVFLALDAASYVTGQLLAVDDRNLALNAGGSRLWPSE